MPRKTKNRNGIQLPYQKPDYHSQNKLQNVESEPTPHKIKLRTSLDIYHRLLHDFTLDIDLNHVYIGYVDQVQSPDNEMEVCILNWVLIEKGGDIPMHHIQYFDYKIGNVKIFCLWDRKRRLDRLFGSGDTKPRERFHNLINKPKVQMRIRVAVQKIAAITIASNSTSDNYNNRTSDTDDSKEAENTLGSRIPPFIKSNFLVWHHSMKFPINISPNLPNSDPMLIHFPRYPMVNGFAESIDHLNTTEIVNYLSKYGIVVVRNLFTQRECNDAIDSMCDEIYKSTLRAKPGNASVSKIDVTNPETWENNNFPNAKNWRFLLSNPAMSKYAFKNRCKKSLYQLFQFIYSSNTNKEVQLNVTIDNWGIARGTYLSPNNIRKKWTAYLNPHWDINPWSYNEQLLSGHYFTRIYQGALALTDQTVYDGTHLTLPGGANYLDTFCSKHAPGTNPYRHNIALSDPIIKYMQPMPLQKGDFVIWDYGQLHATTPNQSSRMRIMQYIRMFPSSPRYIKRDHYSAQAVFKKFKTLLTKKQLETMLRSIYNEGQDDGLVDFETSLKLLDVQKWKSCKNGSRAKRKL